MADLTELQSHRSGSIGLQFQFSHGGRSLVHKAFVDSTDTIDINFSASPATWQASPEESQIEPNGN